MYVCEAAARKPCDMIRSVGSSGDEVTLLEMYSACFLMFSVTPHHSCSTMTPGNVLSPHSYPGMASSPNETFAISIFLGALEADYFERFEAREPDRDGKDGVSR